MNLDDFLRPGERFVRGRFPNSGWLAVTLLCGTFCGARLQAESGRAPDAVVLWDTRAPLTEPSIPNDRSGWGAVPSDIVQMESNPAKAASDPGYYGREFAFRGDAVVENAHLLAWFASGTGKLVIYGKSEADAAGRTSSWAGKLVKCTELSLAQPAGRSIRQCHVLRNADDEVWLKVDFDGAEGADRPMVFAFGKDAVIEVKPPASAGSFELAGPIAGGVVPGYVTDDLVFRASDYGKAARIELPAENLFAGLMEGENSMLVMTWPKGGQHLSLRLPEGGGETFSAVEFRHDGRPFYLAPITAPGVWHREVLNAGFLEKDVTIPWKKPFPAAWRTQLDELGVQATYTFRESKGEIWRGVAGSYLYPVWFDGGESFYHLSKKIPPKGESVVYFLEGNETPSSVLTPFDMLKQTLGREASDEILDPTGRSLRTHHRRGAAGVHRACTCGCTEAIQAVFEAGEETERKEDVAGDLDDMIYFVQRHIARIDEYQKFARETIALLRGEAKAKPALRETFQNLEQIVAQIPQVFEVQKDNMKSLDYARELRAKTLALTARKDPGNVAAYMELLKDWRGMGGAQDDVLAHCHVIARRFFQESGYACALQPDAVPTVQTLRAYCRNLLRHPDGYEVWANY